MPRQLSLLLIVGTTLIYLALGTHPAQGAGAFHDELLDGAARTGYYSSLDLDSQGEPHIAYYDLGANRLMYTYRRGGTWYSEEITGGGGGRHCSLVLDANDDAHVAFHGPVGHGTLGLSYAYRYRGGWTIETVDATSGRGTWCDLALDSTGTPHISYHSTGSGGELWYATHSRLIWTQTMVDTTGRSGLMSAIALDLQGNPHIVHHDGSAQNLRRTWYTGTVWSREVVYAGAPSGLSPDIQVDFQGKIYVSHYAQPGGLPMSLIFSKRWGSWTHDPVDSGGTNGAGTSITLDGFRNPYIAYSFSGAGGELEYARHDGSNWHYEVASSSFAGADHPSIQRTSEGAVYISYQRSSSENLAFLSSEWLDSTPTVLDLPNPTTGVAWPDANNDGHLDIFLTQSGAANRLATGSGWGSFAELPSTALNGTGSSFGVAWADYDNDGDQDAIITNLTSVVELVRNDGLGQFTNVTAGDLLTATATLSADWVDYDNDGDLDLYLCGYTIPSMLMRNDGGDTFTDITPTELAITSSFTANWADFDHDGWMDVYVGVRSADNVLFQNQAGSFVDVSSPEILGPGSTRGAAVGDFNNDGWLDFYMVNDADANQLLLNQGAFSFADVSASPVDDPGYGYEADWFDYDNDGDLDLFLTNYTSENKLFRNDLSGFVDITHGPMAIALGSRGMGIGDMDEDGDLDIFIAHNDTQNVLVQNIASNGNHWLHVDLQGTYSNSSAIGARVWVHSTSGTQFRQHLGSTAYISQSSATLEFGLGTDSSVELIEVLWPSGIYSSLTPATVDTRLTMVEPSPLGDSIYRGMSYSFSSGKLKGLDFASQAQIDLSENLGSLPDFQAMTNGPSPNEAYALVDFDGYQGVITLDPTAGVITDVKVLQYPYAPWATWINPYGIAWDPLANRVYTMLQIWVGQSVSYALGRVDLETGWVKNLPNLTVNGTLGSEGFMAIAFDSDGRLHAVSQPIPNERLEIWVIGKPSMTANELDTTANEYPYCEDISFIGDEFWILTDSGEAVCQQIGLRLGGDYAPELAMADFLEAPVGGLAGRPCIGTEGFLSAQDVPSDPGDQIDLDWSAYPNFPEIDQFEVLRGSSACELLDPSLPPIASGLDIYDTSYRDSFADSYVSFHYGVRVLNAMGDIIDVLTAPPAFSFPNVLINEFAPAGGVQAGPGASQKRIGEFVEIFNDTGAPLDLNGYRLSNGAGPPSPDEEFLPADVIPTGGYYSYTLTTIDLPDAGGTLILLPPGSAAAAVDVVAYGTMGGAPTVPAGFTVSRVPGTTAETPDELAFEASTSTSGAANDVPTPDLGNSLLVNEVYYEGTLGNDFVELINPLGSGLSLDRIVISDGVAFLDTLELSEILAPGELTVFGAGGLPWVRDLSGEQLYLYKITSTNQLQRVDQLGWAGGPTPVDPQNALQRVPDGAAVYLGDSGTNWVECGGDISLLYGIPSPGLPNTTVGQVVVTVDPGGGGDYTDISTAIENEGPNTQILVMPGDYAENISLEDSTEIIGQVVGESRPVILGDASGSPAVTAAGVDASAKLSSISIKGVSASAGSALRITAASPTISQVVFEENISSDVGGAVLIDGGSPIFDGCSFLENEAANTGGAVQVFSGTPYFTRCLFVRNEAIDQGGALHSLGGTTIIQRSIMDRNGSWDHRSGVIHAGGGGIGIDLSAVTFSISGRGLGVNGGGQILFSCGSLHGNQGTTVESADLVTLEVVPGDPLYCEPLALGYALQDASPLADKSATSCNETIGITGPPCLPIVTDTPSAQRAVNRLDRPYPNPFNPRALLGFEIARAGVVELVLYDQRGRRVAELVGGKTLRAGHHSVSWEGRDLRGAQVASGVYFARLKLDGERVGEPQRLVLLK